MRAISKPFAGFLTLLLVLSLLVRADNVAQTLPFAQNWTSTDLITVSDNWAGVPGIEGYRGDGLASTGADPQTVLGESSVLDVNANQTNPSTFATGGVAEFHLANPTIALNGSGTADAPYIVMYVSTLGMGSIRVTYNLRDLDGSADNAVQQVALQYRVGSSGTFINVPAGYVADATTGPSDATVVTAVDVVLPPDANNRSELQIRVITADAGGNDEWVGVDDIQITGTALPRTLSISDVSITEGHTGISSVVQFTVTLSSPAGPGGVSFDIATADDTATAGSGDYVARSLVNQLIPAGASQATFDVTINGDEAFEPHEVFVVNVTGVVGAEVGDSQGIGTILNDELAAIHDIQGSGARSPVAGMTVTTRGIVTAHRSNGFFLQEPDASVDGNAMTSEGVLVFTGGPPPPAAIVGNRVEVTGLVTEFVPSSDPNQPPLTEIAGSLIVAVLGTNQPLPQPVVLTPAHTHPAGPHDQLEIFEGMRVSVPSLTVVAATLGGIDEPTATGFSNGVFFGVITGLARPFREPGVPLPDPLPGSWPPGLPRFDSNPERLRVDSDGQTGASAIDVSAGALVLGLVGPLDYAFRTYTILPDPATPPVVNGGSSVRAVRAASGIEATIASFNLQRFFDTADAPGTGDAVLTPAAFDGRLSKASRAIRELLRAPDVLGVVEIENLAALEAVAARISQDAIAAGQPDPQYTAYLQEGNDPGGIDVGFLVKTAPITGGAPRVAVQSVTQEGLDTTFIDPSDGSVDILNDRPPLVLLATVHFADGRTLPVTVIVNHLRSLNDAEADSATGRRVRAKRAAQAEFLASLVQARQSANAGERLVVVGDFNAFQFNDGLVDVMGTIVGAPAAPHEVLVPTQDLVAPNLVNLMESLPDPERYSYVFDGSAQVLDHILVNAAALVNVSGLEMLRGNSDAPETARNDFSSAARLSDHDAPVVYLRAPPIEVTGRVTIKVTPLGFNPQTKVAQGVVIVTNTSNAAIDAPIELLFDDLTPGVTLLNADGAFAGAPYITLLPANLPLLPGQSRVTLVRFANPNEMTITYTPRVFSLGFER